MIYRLLLILCLWLTALPAAARQSVPVDTGNTEISLVSNVDSTAAGETFTVALRMAFDGNWYTYWRNAGDSGEPVAIQWDLPDGVTAGPIQWAPPKVKTVGPIVSYAMDKEVYLPIEITVADTVDPSRPIRLGAQAYFLVCDDVCIPEDGALSVMIGGGETVTSSNAPRLIEAKADVPKRGEATGAARLAGEDLQIDIASLPADFSDANLFPHANPIIVHSDPVTLSTGTKGIRYTATPNYGWEEGTPEDFDVTLVAEDGQTLVVPISTSGTVDIGTVAASSASAVGGANIGFLGAIIGAILGGLILNLMPCVFPIISLKALSLAKTAHGERRSIRRAGWAYTGGVLVSFAIFAAILIALKAAGASVGWGFQLQSPWLVGLLALLLFAIGLNLLGMFEISGRFQNLGGDRVQGSGPLSSFLTGVLAVIVATPCSAPFMAGAVGYALASSAGVTLAVFLALGFGFALPFLLVTYIPGALARLPKPGPWMESFRQFLAFPMFAAAIWLVWVLALQAGAAGVGRLLLGALALGFAIWLFQRSGRFARVLAIPALIAALWLPLGTKPSGDAQLEAQIWSPEAVAAARATGNPVFVDFTAAWCVTCKVNETLVINSSKTAELFNRTDTVFFVADWTNKDDVIAAELARYGRAGVPLYLAYRPDADAAEVLPQILTYDIIEAALE